MPEPTVLRAEVTAWAKINLDLRILAREESGYHQLETLFQRITLADDVHVTISRGTGISVICTPAVDVPMQGNLAWRAAAAYRDAAAWPPRSFAITITIAKRIPAGAGLGGGSADAGAVLRALNALNPTPLALDALLTLAAPLGADVPFLTTESSLALAWGRGERMLALPPLPLRSVHCALFRNGVNTVAAYAALAAARTRGAVTGAGSVLHDAQTLANWSAIHAQSRNDFEQPIFALRPDIAAVHVAWRSAAPDALVRMSGSGATVIALVYGVSDAVTEVAAAWPSDGDVQHVRAATLDRVPPVSILSEPSSSR
jgi:4-diphosphocytidyl-2-C-methyl-D-erythritol kinase